ncbi:MAG: sulfatase, partial [Myxococcota bacterium]
MRPTCLRPALGPLLALLLVGCGAGDKDTGASPADTDTAAPDTADTDAPSVDCPEGHADFDPVAAAPPGFVLLLTADTLNRDFLGVHHEWDTTPNLDALFRDGVVLENVLMARGLSAPSLATVLTGEYPRVHGIRDNTSSLPRVPMMQERFQEAGWQTIAASGNMCFLASRGIDAYFCNWGGLEEGEGGEGTGDLAADEELVDAFLAQLDARDPEKPTFAWLHLMSPHDPYIAEPAYYEEFHPEAYDGEFEDATEGPLTAMQLGALPWSEADMRHLHAVYASELRGTDALIGRVLDGIAERGLADDGVLVFGSDHGDELGTRPDTNYIWHGCSVYNPVVATTWAIRAPGRLAAGETLRGWVSAADLAPTVLSLAQVPPGAVEGTSLVPDILACEDPGRP